MTDGIGLGGAEPRRIGTPSSFRGTSVGGTPGTPPRSLQVAPPPTPPRTTPIAVPEPTPKRGRAGLKIAVCAILLAIAGSVVWFFARQPSTPERTAELSAPPPVAPSPLSLPTPVPRYAHADGFSFLPPKDWVMEASGEKVTFRKPTAEESPGGPFAASIAVTAETVTEGSTLDQYVARRKTTLSNTFPDFALIDDARTTTEDGDLAHILGGTFTQGALTLRSKQLVTVFDTTGYTVTGTALASVWDAAHYNALFDEVLVSFMPP